MCCDSKAGRGLNSASVSCSLKTRQHADVALSHTGKMLLEDAFLSIYGLLHTQVRVWVPAAVMRRAQAMMVQGTGPDSSGLMLKLTSSFYESSVPLQVNVMLSCFSCLVAYAPCLP